MDNLKDSGESGAALGMSWSYLKSWRTSQGAINGPVVHRCDLKRLQKTHDTAWTQSAVIEGLVTLAAINTSVSELQVNVEPRPLSSERNSLKF